MENKAQCPGCSAEFTALEILNNCTLSFPNQKWIWFHCPACKKQYFAELHKGKILLGDIDGAPGPAFFPSSELAVANFTFSARTSGITCQLGKEKFFYKAR